MNEIVIANTKLKIKDYFCASDRRGAIPNPNPRLWLYVNLTNMCPAKCPFCVNPYARKEEGFDLKKFRYTLEYILPNVSGISITGGEPTMDIGLLDDVVEVISDVVDEFIEIDLVTNGMFMDKLIGLPNIDRFTTIHISRHMVNDEANRKVFGVNVPTEKELSDYLLQLNDPGAVVFNCVLRQDGVNDIDSVKEYLEMAARIGVNNTSFIGMFPANLYCESNYVSPGSIDFRGDGKFRIINSQHDYEYCNCLSGDYLSEHGYTRFYCRWPGQKCQNYCRQLVYDSDNRLLDGFFGNVIHI
ncbi:MAG: radical SAM protein [Parabacteroides sp.]|nr:radical SAM protein [Parabacteroides sp.]